MLPAELPLRRRVRLPELFLGVGAGRVTGAGRAPITGRLRCGAVPSSLATRRYCSARVSLLGFATVVPPEELPPLVVRRLGVVLPGVLLFPDPTVPLATGLRRTELPAAAERLTGTRLAGEDTCPPDATDLRPVIPCLLGLECLVVPW